MKSLRACGSRGLRSAGSGAPASVTQRADELTGSGAGLDAARAANLRSAYIQIHLCIYT